MRNLLLNFIRNIQEHEAIQVAEEISLAIKILEEKQIISLNLGELKTRIDKYLDREEFKI